MAGRSRFSLFAQRIDRAAGIAYLLGAVVPLTALVFLTLRYVAVADLDDAVGGSLFRSRPLLVGLIATIAVLSLAAFLALRRTARQALDRFDEDTQRLSGLVRSSKQLAAAPDANDALRIATERAAELTTAQAAFCLRKAENGEMSKQVSRGYGADRAFSAYGPELQKLGERAVAGQAATFSRLEGASAADSGLATPRAATAVPCGSERALVIVYGEQGAEERAINTSRLATLGSLATSALRTLELQSDQQNFFTHVTNLLIKALDTHLGYHGDHSRNVARLATRLGRELQLDEAHLERLHFAGLLHDIGMLSIPRDRLSEREAIEKHPGLGADVLERIDLWEDLAGWVRHHHEWWDGSGYPARLVADEIPLESRIIGLAEAFDSMTSMASYKPAVNRAEALRRIQEAAGTQFDPRLAERFLAMEGSARSPGEPPR